MAFILKDNFRFPYAAIGFSDFWRRWHISLSTFLRDYLYIPLGGNQVRPVRAAINLVIVMFLGGLWHGAAWTFVVWGLLHGSYLVIERVIRVFFEDTAMGEQFRHQILRRTRYLRRGLHCVGVFSRVRFHYRSVECCGACLADTPSGDAILSTREMLQIAIVTACMMRCIGRCATATSKQR